VRAITTATKSIEYKLSGDLWNSQTLWTEKKSVYGNLLSTLHTMQVACQDMFLLKDENLQRKSAVSAKRLPGSTRPPKESSSG
jgi:hypothetical protein